MSLKKIEQIEHLEYWWQKTSNTPWKDYSASRKSYKKLRNRWLRRFKKLEIPPIKYRKGWEY
jgi:hypothetical protein